MRKRLVYWIFGLVIIALVGIGLLTLLVRQVEPRMAFFPYAGEDGTPAAFQVPFTAMDVRTSDGERVHVWHLPHPAPRAQVLYFHGNGGNLSIWTDILVGVWRQGFDVIALDYRGYGLSTGRPSESGLYRDIDAVLPVAHGQLRARGAPMIYWGRSLGTTMAAYAASARPPDAVILEAGFPSMRAVVASNPLLWVLSWMSSYRFPTAEWMRNVRVPVLVLHGDRDSVIEYSLGQDLFQQLPEPKRFVTLPGGDHNEPVPPDAASYWRAITGFADEAGARPGR